jgi:transcriptional regulator with XRE-family HTH domain
MDDAPGMGKKLGKRRNGPVLAVRRLAALIAQLEQRGMSGVDLADLIGVGESRLNKLKNYESSGRTSFEVEIVGRVMHGLKIDPLFFFEEYDDAKEGTRDYRLYLLSAKRDEKRVSAIEETVKRLEVGYADLTATNASQAAELIRLRQQLADASKQGATASHKRR